MNPKLLPIIFLFSIQGCTYFLESEASRRKQLEDYWNSKVGMYYKLHPSHKMESRDLRPGVKEYILRQYYECRLALEMDESTSQLISWRYASDPENCWVYFPTAW